MHLTIVSFFFFPLFQVSTYWKRVLCCILWRLPLVIYSFLNDIQLYARDKEEKKTGYDQTMKITGVIFYQVSTFRALMAPSSLLWSLSFTPRVRSTGRSCSHLRPLLKQVHLFYSMYMHGPNPLFIYSRWRDAGVMGQEVEGRKEDKITFKPDTNDRLSCWLISYFEG